MGRYDDMLGKQVRAFSGGIPEHTVAIGEVVAIADFPTFVIVTADGRRVHWAAHLTEPAEPPLETA